MKERLLVSDIKSAINQNGAQPPIILIAGLRKVGKTYILMQLKDCYRDSIYIDCSVGYEARNQIEGFIHNPHGILLIDELTTLKEYESLMAALYDSLGGSKSWKAKVVVTASSAAHLCKLATGKLGGGRSTLFYLPPISFIEYLYFTNKISDYSNYGNPTVDDFKDYLLLRGLPPEMCIFFDQSYLRDAFFVNEQCNDASAYSPSHVDLGRNDLVDLANLIAYQLAEPYNRQTLKAPTIGAKELRNLIDLKYGIPDSVSESLMTQSQRNLRGIYSRDFARLLVYLIQSRMVHIGILCDDFEVSIASGSEISREIERIGNYEDFADILKRAHIFLNSPLVYTRLGSDILQTVGIDIEKLVCDDNTPLVGSMLEIYISGALARYDDPLLPFQTVKLSELPLGEVDIWDINRKILLEITAGRKDKPLKGVYVNQYFPGCDYIRILSTYILEDEVKGLHRIPYPKLCCMIDTKDILRILKTKGML